MAEAVSYIYTDNHLLVANKPAGVPSQPDASGDPSLVELAKEHIRRRFDKPGNVFLSLVHRLDRPTSGVVVLARTDKAASRMADLFRRRDIGKTYLAVVECQDAPPATASLTAFLAPADNGSMRPVQTKTRESREARLDYRVVDYDASRRRALLEINLHTGVKHQIRCQLAWAGMPVVGDFRYGAGGAVARPTPVMGGRAILLHAAKIAFVHPVRREPVVFDAPLPGYWGEAAHG